MSQIASAAGTPAAPPAAPAEDGATKVARAFFPHIDRLIDDSHKEGPQLAWALHLDPTDAEAKAALEKLTARLAAWSKVKAALLSDPGLPPALVEQFSDAA